MGLAHEMPDSRPAGCRFCKYGCPVIRERVPGFDPRAFWTAPLAPARVADMREKYEALAALARAPDDERRKSMLRVISRRWPGSLREAELAGPDRIAERL